MICYTDGSCSGNGTNKAKGGYAIVVNTEPNVYVAYCANGITKEDEGYDVTNNRMEMKAILWTLIEYGQAFPPVTVYSDSAYCVNTFTDWMIKWQRNGWKRPGGKRIENLDLVQTYYNWSIDTDSPLVIDLQKVAGHAEVLGNELADLLAKGEIDKAISKAIKSNVRLEVHKIAELI